MATPVSEQWFDRVVMGIYGAAGGKQTWGAAMNNVARLFDAWGVQLMGLNKSDATVLFSHDGGQASPESALDYIRTYHQRNPRVPATLALGPGEWLHDHEVFDEAFVAGNPFYRDFLIPYGGRYLSGTKVLDDDERLVVFGAMRGCGKEPFDAVERTYLERLRQHLTAALEIQSHLRMGHAQLHAGAALLNQFNRPMILIDAERAIRFSNPAGRRTMEEGDYVCERNGVLRCRDKAADRALSLALYELRLLDGLHHSSPPPNRRFFRTHAASDGTPIGIYLVALRPQATMGAFGHAPRALVFFHDLRTSPVLDPMIVAETFDLTPAEARVAVAIADGQTVEKIALRHGVSVQTVRTQLGAVFSKTNTARQADLVRLLVAMPALSLTEP